MKVVYILKLMVDITVSNIMGKRFTVMVESGNGAEQERSKQMSELKSCPWCSGDIKRNYIQDRKYLFKCERCGAEVIKVARGYDEADALWNTRVRKEQTDGR